MFYTWLLRLAADKFFNVKNAEYKGNFLVVSTIPEYQSLVYPMTPTLYKNGWKELMYLLRTAIYFDLNDEYGF